MGKRPNRGNKIMKVKWDGNKEPQRCEKNNFIRLWEIGGLEEVEKNIPYVKDGVYELKRVGLMPNVRNIKLLTATTMNGKEYLIPMKYKGWILGCVNMAVSGFNPFPSLVIFDDNGPTFVIEGDQNDKRNFIKKTINERPVFLEKWMENFPDDECVAEEKDEKINFFVERFKFMDKYTPKINSSANITNEIIELTQTLCAMRVKLYEDMKALGIADEVNEIMSKHYNNK